MLSFLVSKVSVKLLYPNPGRMTKRIDLTEMKVLVTPLKKIQDLSRYFLKMKEMEKG